MRFFFALLLFCGAVALFTVVAKVMYQSSVETQLVSLADEALKEAGYSNVLVAFDHHSARFSGHVDSEEDKAKVRLLVKEVVPIAVLPEPENMGLEIRPTIPPAIAIVKNRQDTSVLIQGALGAEGEASRTLLGSRIHNVDGVDAVKNEIVIDPRRLALVHVAELASLAGGLLEHSEEAEVRFEDGVLQIRGTVPNEGIKSALLELAGQVEGATIEESIGVTPPETFFVPATVSMTRNRFGITVGGVIQSEEARNRVTQALENLSGGLRITDRIEIDAERVEAPWQSHFETVLTVLFEQFVGEMTVEFAEAQIRLNGEVAGEDGKAALLASLDPIRSVSENLEILSDIQIRESMAEKGPAVRLLAVYEPGLLSLTGNVPDDSFIASLERTFKEAEMEVLIKNSLEVTKSSPGEGWKEGLEDLLEAMPGHVEQAVFKLADGILKMEGTTIELADRQLLQNLAVNAVPPEFAIENLLIHADQPFPMPELLPEDRARIGQSLENVPIYFDTGSEILSEDGRKAVDSIFETLKEGGAQVDLIVTGYADNVGNAESNRELSQRRAEAVIEVLLEAGIEEARIEKRNEIEDVSRVRRSERWKSRRVEVTLASDDEADSE